MNRWLLPLGGGYRSTPGDSEGTPRPPAGGAGVSRAEPAEPAGVAFPALPLPSDFSFEPPYAEVRQSGRWSYAVIVKSGPMEWGPGGGPWLVYGSRARAERKGRRVLRKYLVMLERDRGVTRVTDPDERCAACRAPRCALM